MVLCLAHGGCYTRRNITRHLGEQHQLRRQAKKQALASLEAADIAVGPEEAQHPAHGAEAISGLPLLDGFRCLHLCCGHSSVSVEAIKQNCFQAHGWRRRKHQVAPVEEGGRPTLPYRPAKLQTLFAETKQRRYFEARPPGSTFTRTPDADAARDRREGEDGRDACGSEPAGGSIGSQLGACGPQWETVMRRYRAAQRLRETGRYMAVEEAAYVSEITPWLKSTGFAAHLVGVAVAGLPSSYRLPDPRRPQQHGEEAGEAALAHICDSVERVLRKAMAAMRDSHSDTQRLSRRDAKLLNTFRAAEMSQKPMQPLQTGKARTRYIATWQKLVCYFARVTSGQCLREDLFCATETQLDGFQGGGGGG